MVKVRISLHIALCTLHIAVCSLHIAHCILHMFLSFTYYTILDVPLDVICLSIQDVNYCFQCVQDEQRQSAFIEVLSLAVRNADKRT